MGLLHRAENRVVELAHRTVELTDATGHARKLWRQALGNQEGDLMATGRKLDGDATTAEEFAPGFTGGGDKEKASQGEEWGLRSKA